METLDTWFDSDMTKTILSGYKVDLSEFKAEYNQIFLDMISGFDVSKIDTLFDFFKSKEFELSDFLNLFEGLFFQKEEFVEIFNYLVVRFCEFKLSKINKLLSEYKKAVDVSNIVSKSDLKGRVTFVNDKFCEISGYSREELMGRPHSIVRHPNMPKEAFADLWNTINSKKVWRGRVENLAKDGSSYFVDATIVPILDEDNNIVEFIGIRKDVTEQILRERELEELRVQETKSNLNKAIDINYQKSLDFYPLASAIIGDSDKILYYNREFYSLFNIIEDRDNLEQLREKELVFTDIFTLDSGLLDHEIYDWKELICEEKQKFRFKESKFILSMKKIDKNKFIIVFDKEIEEFDV